MADSENEDVPKHLQRVETEIYLGARDIGPIYRHLCYSQSRSVRDVENFDVEAESVRALTFEKEMRGPAVEKLEPALRVRDAGHD